MADEEQNACKTSYNKQMLKACIQPIRFAQVGFLDIWLGDSRQCGNFFYVHFEVVYMIVQTILFRLSVAKKKEKFIVTIEEMDVLF